MYLGSHMSIAGGLHLACERGREVGANVIQIFTRNQQQWAARPIRDDEARQFRASMKEHRIRQAFAHDTYLINLASVKDALWKKSLNAFVHELERCDLLGLDYLVTHPGAPGKGNDKEGVPNMIRALDEAHARTRGVGAKILLETTAGQGTVMGWRFEQMKEIREGLKEPERLGFCFDTCHVFAAGYDIRTPQGYDAVMEEFDRVLGVENILAFHLNDSKKDLGCRVDRHEHIGQGCIGQDAFRCLMNDVRFEKVPKVLETPKDDNMDVVNLNLLRSFVKRKSKAKRA